ncbi:hypothetical protein [Rhizobium sp. RU35A]|uniref:hypothetical protein n=1 Tax=Rhizobium sp. RU35A TaxID=1907414 RepID=UPI00122C15A2|nr:hypothetical protein [Rhizobium sp. RU35A]
MKASTSNGCDAPEASPAFDGGTNGSKAVIMPAQEGQRGSDRLSLASLIAGHDLAVDKRGKVCGNHHRHHPAHGERFPTAPRHVDDVRAASHMRHDV